MKRGLSLLILTAYLAIGGFGFFHTYQMAGHGHMDTAPCPFMQDQDAICPMSALGHFAAWQNMFAGIIPEAFLFVPIILCIVLFLRSAWPPGEDRQTSIFEECSLEAPSLYQLLFSQGILNPKAP